MRVQLPWLRSMRGEREPARATGVLDVIMVGTVAIAALRRRVVLLLRRVVAGPAAADPARRLQAPHGAGSTPRPAVEVDGLLDGHAREPARPRPGGKADRQVGRGGEAVRDARAAPDLRLARHSSVVSAVPMPEVAAGEAEVLDRGVDGRRRPRCSARQLVVGGQQRLRLEADDDDRRHLVQVLGEVVDPAHGRRERSRRRPAPPVTCSR